MKGDDEDVMKPYFWWQKTNETKLTILSLALIIMGIIVTFAVVTLSSANYTWPNENFENTAVGAGIGLIFMGVLMLYLHRWIKKNPHLAKEMAISSTDERNLLILNKAKAKTFEITLLAITIVYLITIIFTDSPQQILPLALIMIVAGSSYLLLQRKYKKEM